MEMRIILDSISTRIGARLRRAPAVPAAFLLPWLLLAGPLAHAGGQVYQSPEAFLEEAFPAGAPEARALWLKPPLRHELENVLGRRPSPRIRYWQSGAQTAWVLDEVGKDEPITAGVVVRDGAIDDIRVLVFRESRGWEVKYPFFTRQFQDARLTSDRRLSRPIDGITGATLSVRAMKRMARAALLLDAHTRRQAGDLATAR